MTKYTRELAILGPLIVAAALVAGCAAGDPKFTETEPAGFLYGLWHGFIIVITFIISLFSDQTTIYEVHNSGGWYNFGFVLGVL